MTPLRTLTPLPDGHAPTQLAPRNDVVLMAFGIATIVLGVLLRLI
ncbi:MAG: hypothetical protein ACKOYM_10600 [Actinomycetes bacterium]